MNLGIHAAWPMIAVAMVVSGCCRPILYKPTANPSTALVSIRIPETISTLDGLPGDLRKTDMEWIERTGASATQVKRKIGAIHDLE